MHLLSGKICNQTRPHQLRIQICKCTSTLLLVGGTKQWWELITVLLARANHANSSFKTDSGLGCPKSLLFFPVKLHSPWRWEEGLLLWLFIWNKLKQSQSSSALYLSLINSMIAMAEGKFVKLLISFLLCPWKDKSSNLFAVSKYIMMFLCWFNILFSFTLMWINRIKEYVYFLPVIVRAEFRYI